MMSKKYYQQLRYEGKDICIWYSCDQKIFTAKAHPNCVRCAIGAEPMQYLLNRNYLKDGIDLSIPYEPERL